MWRMEGREGGRRDGDREVVSLMDIDWVPTGGGKSVWLLEEARRVGGALERCREVERKAELMSEQAELWRKLGR